jgi:hypothetical protein
VDAGGVSLGEAALFLRESVKGSESAKVRREKENHQDTKITKKAGNQECSMSIWALLFALAFPW